MSAPLTIRGLPDRLKQDAWWLSGSPNPSRTRQYPEPGLGARISDGKAAILALLILIALADISFWGQRPGLSVAVFCLGLSAAMLACKPNRSTPREWAIGMGFALACNLPMIEQAQALSFGFSIAGIIALLTWVCEGPRARIIDALGLFSSASTKGLKLFPRFVADGTKPRRGSIQWRGVMQDYLLPVSVGIIFVALFAIANPLLERAIVSVGNVGPIHTDTVLRLLFWAALACVLWPYLNTKSLHRNASFTVNLPNGDLSAGYFNLQSVRLSLVLFNAIFAVQTLSDLTVLTGGVALPEGLTYAQYAHQGAYPLMATALLAGLFAVLTQKMVARDKHLRWLVYAWLAQTLLLVFSAAFRLALYVEAYALTHLRVAAFIWMALIAVGLVLIVVQIAQNRPLSWLIRCNAALAVATLYLCCFVNFTYLIADHNLSADLPIERLDLAYLCGLGEQVIPAMWDYGPIYDDVMCGVLDRPEVRFDDIESWQEWGFRRWRLEAYLTAHHDL